MTVTGVVHADLTQRLPAYLHRHQLTGPFSDIRLVSVVDTTPPVITILGANPIDHSNQHAFRGSRSHRAGRLWRQLCRDGQRRRQLRRRRHLSHHLFVHGCYGNLATAVRTVVVRNYSILVSNANDSGVGSLRQAIVDALWAAIISSLPRTFSGASILLTNGQR